jgi:hypothetical protein
MGTTGTPAPGFRALSGKHSSARVIEASCISLSDCLTALHLSCEALKKNFTAFETRCRKWLWIHELIFLAGKEMVKFFADVFVRCPIDELSC